MPIAAWTGAVGRLLISLIFLWDSVVMLTNPQGTLQFIQSSGMPLPAVAYAGAVVVQLAGGATLLLGWKARWAAAALALYCLATALIFHTNWTGGDAQIHFFKNLAMAGGLAQILAFGAGSMSLDGRRRRR